MYQALPREGQVSLTITQENYQVAKDYYEAHKTELASKGVKSLPQLYQVALKSYIGFPDAKPGRPTIRTELLLGFLNIVSSNIFQENYTYSLAFILREMLLLIPQTEIQPFLAERYTDRLNRFGKLKQELTLLLGSNELSGDQEARLKNIIHEIVLLVSEYISFLVDSGKKTENATDDKKNRFSLTVQGFCARYISMVIPFMTTVLTLTGNEADIYFVSQQLDSFTSSSIVRLASTISKWS